MVAQLCWQEMEGVTGTEGKALVHLCAVGFRAFIPLFL